MRTVKAAAFAAALLVLPQALEAHDAWADGDPIPTWVKTECCSQAHAHHIDDGALHARPDGYHVDGYKWTIPYSQALPSPGRVDVAVLHDPAGWFPGRASLLLRRPSRVVR